MFGFVEIVLPPFDYRKLTFTELNTAKYIEYCKIAGMATNMEVDTPGTSVMATAGTSGSVSVALHPLVIMNISEHWTRVRAQEGKPMQGVNVDCLYQR